MLNLPSTPENLPNYHLGLVQGHTPFTKGKKDITVEDYFNYTKTSGVDRLRSKLGLLLEGKGWVDEKSLKKLAINTLSSLKTDDLAKINSVANQIIKSNSSNPSQNGNGTKEDNDKQQAIANQVLSLVTDAYRNKDIQVKEALKCLYTCTLEVQKDKGEVKRLYVYYIKRMQEGSKDLIEKCRNPTILQAAADSLARTYVPQTIMEGFVELLAELITENKLTPKQMSSLCEFVKDHGSQKEFEAIDNIRKNPL